MPHGWSRGSRKEGARNEEREKGAAAATAMGEEGGEKMGAPERPQQSDSNAPMAKSCKGCVYYSSSLKSKSKNPRCVGIPRSFPQVPSYVIKEFEKHRSLTDFKYCCVGYSVYLDGKDKPSNEEKHAELPVCVGLEVLVGKAGATSPNNAPAPTPVQRKEDGHRFPETSPPKPTHPDEFLTRFTRNANLVAMGMAKNMRKVGNYIKQNVDDILYPYRRRPK